MGRNLWRVEPQLAHKASYLTDCTFVLQCISCFKIIRFYSAPETWIQGWEWVSVSVGRRPWLMGQTDLYELDGSCGSVRVSRPVIVIHGWVDIIKAQRIIFPGDFIRSEIWDTTTGGRGCCSTRRLHRRCIPHSSFASIQCTSHVYTCEWMRSWDTVTHVCCCCDITCIVNASSDYLVACSAALCFYSWVVCVQQTAI